MYSVPLRIICGPGGWTERHPSAPFSARLSYCGLDCKTPGKRITGGRVVGPAQDSFKGECGVGTCYPRPTLGKSSDLVSGSPLPRRSILLADFAPSD
jgi:hypothetical protein